MTSTDWARYAVTLFVTILGVGVSVAVFMGLAALGNIFRLNSRPQDDQPPASWIARKEGRE